MSDLVVKSNHLNSLGLYKKPMEMKIFARIIAELRDEPERNEFTFWIREMLEEFTNSAENYTQIKTLSKKMMVVEFSEGRNTKLISIFDMVDISESGRITFNINPRFKPQVLELSKSFMKYHISNISRLSTGTTIRIYEILKQWESVEKKEFSIIELKKMLNISESKYKLYGHFKSKVITPAQKEIEEKTDIKFDFTPVKEGRATVGILFFIYENKPKKSIIIEQKKPIEKEDEPTPEPQFTVSEQAKPLFEYLKINQRTQEKLTTEYSEEILISNLKYTILEFDKGAIKKTVSGYLIGALKEDYAGNSAVNLKQEKEQEHLNNQMKSTMSAILEREKMKSLELDYSDQLDESFKGFIRYSFEELTPHLEKFMKKNAMILSKYSDADFSSPKAILSLSKVPYGLIKTFTLENLFNAPRFEDFAKTKGFDVVKDPSSNNFIFIAPRTKKQSVSEKISDINNFDW